MSDLQSYVASLSLPNLMDLESLVRKRIELLTSQSVSKQQEESDEVKHKNAEWIKFWRQDAMTRRYRRIQDVWNQSIHHYYRYSYGNINYVDDLITDHYIPPELSLKKHQLFTEMTKILFLTDENQYKVFPFCSDSLNQILSEHYREFCPDVYATFEAQYVPPTTTQNMLTE